MSKIIDLYKRFDVDLAADLIKSGRIIALPTDTIYGLAGSVDSDSALNRIYEIKGRDTEKPLAIAVSSVDDIHNVAEIDQFQLKIATQLLPGPVTLLLRRSVSLNPNLNRGVDTVGVRVPDHLFVRELTRITGPIALTSANKSGLSDPIKVQDFEYLWPEIDSIFDQGALQRHIAGPNDFRINHFGSTIVDLTRPRFFTILRMGKSHNRTISILNRFGLRQNK